MQLIDTGVHAATGHTGGFSIRRSDDTGDEPVESMTVATTLVRHWMPVPARRAEEALAVRLPRIYVDLLFQRNGGSLRRRCYPTAFPYSWATNTIGVRALLGIGGERGIDKMSAYWIAEWAYPGIGVVLCDLPSGGHDTVMLDYSGSGPDGDPAITYIDEDRIPLSNRRVIRRVH